MREVATESVDKAVRVAAEGLLKVLPDGVEQALRQMGFVDALVLEVSRQLTPEPPVKVDAGKVILDGFKAS